MGGVSVENLLDFGALLSLVFRTSGRCSLRSSGFGLSGKPLLPHVLVLPVVSGHLVVYGSRTSGVATGRLAAVR
jgi:hypothetical protein